MFAVKLEGKRRRLRPAQKSKNMLVRHGWIGEERMHGIVAPVKHHEDIGPGAKVCAERKRRNPEDQFFFASRPLRRRFRRGVAYIQPRRLFHRFHLAY